MKDITESILEVIENADPLAFGDISVSNQSDGCTVTGRLHTSLDRKTVTSLIQKVVSEVNPERSTFVSLDMPRRGLRVKSQTGKKITEATNRRREAKPLDELEIIYIGMMKTSSLTENKEFKKVNHETFQRVLDPIRVLKFITPIVLDKNYKVIDGNMRLQIALNEGIKEVPVIVVNDDGIKSDFLRLVLNRSTEFQRWHWAEVDNFVDSIPQAQPLLEPLGFFGDRILPTTFFANTVLNYKLDEYNEQQKKYSQDIGLAEWAKIKRKENLRAEKKRQAAKEKKKAPKNAVSLFDLKPKDSDFLETYNAEEEIQKNTEQMRELAGIITDNFDAERKEILEAKGKPWQNTRRTTQQVADDKRAEAAKTKNNKK